VCVCERESERARERERESARARERERERASEKEKLYVTLLFVTHVLLIRQLQPSLTRIRQLLLLLTPGFDRLSDTGRGAVAGSPFQLARSRWSAAPVFSVCHGLCLRK
jgi:hypothetical protein